MCPDRAPHARLGRGASARRTVHAARAFDQSGIAGERDDRRRKHLGFSEPIEGHGDTAPLSFDRRSTVGRGWNAYTEEERPHLARLISLELVNDTGGQLELSAELMAIFLTGGSPAALYIAGADVLGGAPLTTVG